MIITTACLASVSLSISRDVLFCECGVLLCWAEGIQNEFSMDDILIKQLLIESGRFAIGRAPTQPRLKEGKHFRRLKESGSEYPATFEYVRDFVGTIHQEIDEEAFWVLAYQVPRLIISLSDTIIGCVKGFLSSDALSSGNVYVVERFEAMNSLAITDDFDLRPRIEGLAESLCDGLLVRVCDTGTRSISGFALPDVTYSVHKVRGSWHELASHAQIGRLIP